MMSFGSINSFSSVQFRGVHNQPGEYTVKQSGGGTVKAERQSVTKDNGQTVYLSPPHVAAYNENYSLMSQGEMAIEAFTRYVNNL